MIVSIHQPAYLPWLGYFARIAASDVFLFLDTVQFEKNSYTNRNRIKTSNGPIWLTVPLLQEGHMQRTLIDMQIDSKQMWRKKHLRSIEMSYSKAPGFKERFPKLIELYENSDQNFSDFCFKQLTFWLVQLGIRTPIKRASELPVKGKKSDLVLSYCQYFRASEYISGPMGRGYLNEASFNAAGIIVTYQNFLHPTYSQQYGSFVPGMGIVDYWMNCVEDEIFKSRVD